MSNPYFRFKQFTVFHDRCAMKVGTDGVLLGAWSGVGEAVKILDVGTGCGLVALMMAQRNPEAFITAIDIDESAASQARENIQHSPFSDRISVEALSLQQYAASKPAGFDLIVSNPPFFSDSLLPPDPRRTGARHSVTLTLGDLLHFSAGGLAPGGVLSLIIPYDRKDELEYLSNEYHFFLKRRTIVHPLPGTPPKRLLAELTLLPVKSPQTGSLTIECSRHCYTDKFAALVRGFYLENE